MSQSVAEMTRPRENLRCSNRARNCTRLSKRRARAFALDLKGGELRWVPWTSRVTVAAAKIDVIRSVDAANAEDDTVRAHGKLREPNRTSAIVARHTRAVRPSTRHRERCSVVRGLRRGPRVRSVIEDRNRREGRACVCLALSMDWSLQNATVQLQAVF
jgi:hypothetical protein